MVTVDAGAGVGAVVLVVVRLVVVLAHHVCHTPVRQWKDLLVRTYSYNRIIGINSYNPIFPQFSL